jgi:L-fucose mutarotase
MLLGIDVVLNADILYVLRAMGHGDDIAIVDATFPAESHGRRCIRSEGCDLSRMLRAVLTVLPIDRDEPRPVVGMQVIGDPTKEALVHAEIRYLLSERTDGAVKFELLERFEFYARAKNAFAIISTGELRDYGNVIIRKGDRST